MGFRASGRLACDDHVDAVAVLTEEVEDQTLDRDPQRAQVRLERDRAKEHPFDRGGGAAQPQDVHGADGGVDLGLQRPDDRCDDRVGRARLRAGQLARRELLAPDREGDHDRSDAQLGLGPERGTKVVAQSGGVHGRSPLGTLDHMRF